MPMPWPWNGLAKDRHLVDFGRSSTLLFSTGRGGFPFQFQFTYSGVERRFVCIARYFI